MLSLYIHIPYCVKKCLYCGFYSTPYDALKADDYVSALSSEASTVHEDYNHQVFRSVYFGGGTPTVLSESQISGISAAMKANFRVSARAEITVEANPNTATERKLALWRQHGANRLSLGVQSFSDEVLGILGRLHNAAQAKEAFSLARKVGFGNIGMDLIYGVPGQTPAQWEETLQSAVSCGPEHLSLYSLSFDEGSQFKKEADAGRLKPPDDDVAADMYECAVAKLAQAGYRRYELSNFALPGFECRHNMNYWTRGEYLGLGPGAWSFIKGRRSHNVADVHEYIQRLVSGKSLVMEAEVPGPEQSARETIMLKLRTAHGMDLSRFGERYGKRFLEQLERNLAPLFAEGLFSMQGGRLVLTDRGILVSNEAITRLYG
jgi:oxygen-independent coproporphyrinogen III oxidase